MMHEAGCTILGGHSVADDEIKFGYAVTGTVHPARILANAGARPGDTLVFTKRLGTGVIATALKRGIAREADVAASIASMLTLNRAACDEMLRYDGPGSNRRGRTDGHNPASYLREWRFLAYALRVSVIHVQPGQLRDSDCPADYREWA